MENKTNIDLTEFFKIRGSDNMSKLQKPGEKPKKPGEYIERGPRGGKIRKARQVTIDPSDSKLPPTQGKNNKWEWIGR
jgi:hypothetical protein